MPEALTLAEKAKEASRYLASTSTAQRNRALLAMAHALSDKQDEIVAAIRKGTLTGRFHPVFVGAALRNIGIRKLLDGVTAFLPSPLESPAFRPRRMSTFQEIHSMDSHERRYGFHMHVVM